MFTTLDDDLGFVSSLELEEVTFRFYVEKPMERESFIRVEVFLTDECKVSAGVTCVLHDSVALHPLAYWDLALFGARRLVAENFERLRRRYLMGILTSAQDKILRSMVGDDLEILKP